MINKFISTKLAIISSILTTTLVFASNPVTAQFADEANQGITDVSGTETDGDISGLLQTIVNTLLFLIGSLSVVMIIVGGLRYILSNGDPQQATNARNTIIYSVIGVVVAVLAWGIVNYVLGKLYN